MKKWYQSKVLWFNLVGVLFLWILPAVAPDFVLAVPEEWEMFREPVILLVNMFLRLITVKPVDSPLV